jgi:hypothetical protein
VSRGYGFKLLHIPVAQLAENEGFVAKWKTQENNGTNRARRCAYRACPQQHRERDTHTHTQQTGARSTLRAVRAVRTVCDQRGLSVLSM